MILTGMQKLAFEELPAIPVHSVQSIGPAQGIIKKLIKTKKSKSSGFLNVRSFRAINLLTITSN